MIKNFLKDMILPSFWLLFFAGYNKLENKNNTLEKQDKLETRKITGFARDNNSKVSDSKTNFTKGVYISRY